MGSILKSSFLLFLVVIVAVVGSSIAAASSKDKNESFNPGTAWPATDALGRSLPLADKVGPPRPDRFVGIFYFLWHNNRKGKCPYADGPYDIARILTRDPDALKKPNSPLWGPIGRYHYWGEPLYGYYLSDDPWVLRRHAHALADAGIDTLILDTSNAVTYRDVYHALCKVFLDVRQKGGRTPQIAFMVNTRAGKTAETIYRDLYAPGLYRELWFSWRGKPLMICDPAKASAELRAFFTLRRAHWPFTMVNTPYAWHWEATYPQPYGYTDDPKVPEQINVSVAQNLRRSDGKVTNMSSGHARGRSFHAGKVETGPGAVDRGYNFQEQWQRVFDLPPPFVMVTGWNEWIAGRWGKRDGPLVFVDQFDQEHSRDIEPAKVGHRDNYYWQLIANVRRFKGAPSIEQASAPRTISIDGEFAVWRDVTPTFSDHRGETIPRDHDGAGGLHYSDRTGRHDIVVCKVVRDRTSIYFYVQMQKPFSGANDLRGLWLLIDVDQNRATGWEGYDYIVNRISASDGRLSVEKQMGKGAWRWKEIGRVAVRIDGNALHMAIPRETLGLKKGNTRVAIDFKWADNLQRPGDIMNVYLSGDVAPEGRFNFRYEGD